MIEDIWRKNKFVNRSLSLRHFAIVKPCCNFQFVKNNSHLNLFNVYNCNYLSINRPKIITWLKSVEIYHQKN